MSGYRVGRKVGRTIYEQRGDEPSDDDQLIGLMDTSWLAERFVAAMNVAALPDRQTRETAARDFVEIRTTQCRAGSDGECVWGAESRRMCPQIRDNEPATSGRHCPLDSLPGVNTGGDALLAAADAPEDTPTKPRARECERIEECVYGTCSVDIDGAACGGCCKCVGGCIAAYHGRADAPEDTP